MIKVSIFYPNQTDSRFDFDYYFEKHMPMSIERLSPALKGVSVERGLNLEIQGLQTPYSAMAHFLFDSAESFFAAFNEHGTELTADIRNYTDAQPIIQISEVKIFQ
jgi:uncharacterized protein (TIGR02118 family)